MEKSVSSKSYVCYTLRYKIIMILIIMRESRKISEIVSKCYMPDIKQDKVKFLSLSVILYASIWKIPSTFASNCSKVRPVCCLNHPLPYPLGSNCQTQGRRQDARGRV